MERATVIPAGDGFAPASDGDGFAPASDGDGFAPALAAALLGADRAPATIPAMPLDPTLAGDAGGALLARLAVGAVRHLAGSGLAADALMPLPPGVPAGRECPPAAADRLALLLSGGFAAEARLREWCALAAAAGVVAPSWLLPPLARLRDKAPDLVDPVAGPGLDWLARALSGVDAPASAPAGEDWTEGEPAARRAAFAAFREREPDAAREALCAAFKGEKAEMRASLLDTLHLGLGEADEPFLEACLDDRATGVRTVARHLLAELPCSRRADRMAERVRTMLVVEERKRFLLGTSYALTVHLPEDVPELARDGLESQKWGQPGGRRSGLLRDVLSAAPLRAFAAHPPGVWIGMALGSEWALPILEGLIAASRREGDPEWSRAMVAALGEVASGRGPDPKDAALKNTAPEKGQGATALWSRAAALLPGGEWEELVRGAFRTRGAEAVVALLGNAPDGFSPGFTEALVGWFSATIRATRAGAETLARSQAVGRAIERCAPTEGAASAAATLLTLLPEGGDTTAQRLRPQVEGLSGTLSLRLAMRRDFNLGEIG